jgi:hypothetical protein
MSRMIWEISQIQREMSDWIIMYQCSKTHVLSIFKSCMIFTSGDCWRAVLPKRLSITVVIINENWTRMGMYLIWGNLITNSFFKLVKHLTCETLMSSRNTQVLHQHETDSCVLMVVCISLTTGNRPLIC